MARGAVTDPDGHLPPHQPHCLGCGDRNPASLGIRMRVDGDRIRGHVTIDRRHEGAPGFVHGGALSTVLDDALGFVLMILKRPAVTAKLEINFRQPALLDRRFEIEAWADAVEGRKLHLRGELRGEDGLIADARGLFIEVELDHFMRGVADSGSEWAEEAGREGSQLPW